MNVLTKEQIQKLTPDAQEAVASLALGDARRRMRLLEKARRYRGQKWISLLAFAVLMFGFLFGDRMTFPGSDRLIPLAMLFIVWGGAQFQIDGINRRLDAMIELLEADEHGQKKIDVHTDAEPDTPANAD